MDLRFVDPFLDAALSVLEGQLGLRVQQGEAQTQRLADVPGDLRFMFFCSSDQLRGTLLYAMGQATASAILSHILECPVEEIDVLAYVSIAEFGRLIRSQAHVRLAKADLALRISPPVLLFGHEVLVPQLDLPGLLVPLHTDGGPIQVHFTLREMGGQGQRRWNGLQVAGGSLN